MTNRRPVITAHAVVRYLERICGADLDVARFVVADRGGDPTADGAVLEVAETYLGIDVAAARHAMERDAVARAVELGAKSVRIGRARLVIEAGRIVTVERVEWTIDRRRGALDRQRVRQAARPRRGYGLRFCDFLEALA